MAGIAAGVTDRSATSTTDPDVALAEVHGSATIATTGKRYEQDYVMVVRTRNGKIVHYREYWNITPALEAFSEDAPAREEDAS
mgnify:CR=1 FL=1